jgi:hypothetical protein
MKLVLKLLVTIFAFAALSRPATAADIDNDTRTKLYVRISPTPEGVVARYQLARPVARLALEYTDGHLRDGTWSISTPGLLYKDNEIFSDDGREFNQFEVSVAARNELTDAVYPCVMKIGETGRIVYASYFAGRQAEFRSTLEFIADSGSVVLGLQPGATRLEVDRTFFGHQAAAQYVYVGPKAFVREGKQADSVIGPEVPAWLEVEVGRQATHILNFYARKTGVALRRRPLLLFTYEPTAKAFQGDVTDGPAVALRFFGPAWNRRDELSIKSVKSFMGHEVAHFWNSHHFRSQDSDRAPWLHEGGAEYWSHAAQARLGSDSAVDPAIALNECIQRLGVGKLGSSHSKVAYVCGDTLQWLADLGMRQKGRDIFSLWRDMFKRAESNGGFYSSAMFRDMAERTSPSVAQAFQLVLDDVGAQRWLNLPLILKGVGMTLTTQPPTPERIRHSILFHLLNQVCGPGSRGFFTADDNLKLDTGDRCGPLSGDPEIDSANGHNLFTNAAAAYASVKASCETKGAVTFSRAGKPGKWSVTCTAPLPEMPPAFSVNASK